MGWGRQIMKLGKYVDFITLKHHAILKSVAHKDCEQQPIES